MASTGSLYNHSRITRQMLRRHRRSPASIYLHLHPAWIKFEDAKGRLILEEPITAGLEGGMAVAGPSRLGEDGSAVLTPGKELLRCIRDQQLPNYMLDLLDARRIPFYEGCLIVEIKDHRQGPSAPGQAGREPSGLDPHINPKSLAARIEGGRYGKGPAYLAAEKARMDSLANGAAGGAGGAGAAASPLARGPETYRVVLHPTEETLWTELRTLNDKLSGGTWSEEEGLEIESKILNLTSPPLCLTPDPHATRIANIMLATTAPTSRYAPLRPLPHQKTLPPMQPRKVLAGDGEASGANDAEAQRLLVEKRKREAVMRMMAGSWRMYVKDQKNQARTAQAQLPSSSASVAPVSGERPFTPTFSRLNFIERYRAKANGTAVGPGPGEGETTVDSSRDSGAAAANGQEGKAPAASTSTTKKASTTKKRKKQEGSATPGAEDREAPAPKGKKKKTAAAAAAAASPTSPADSTAGSPKAATKAKGATKKKAAAKKGAAADDAPTPAGDAASPAESTADTSMTGKGAKKTTTKKAAAPKGKKAQAAAAAAAAAQAQQQQQQSGSRQSTATPALHHAQLPASSPPRHAGASPFPHTAAAGIATPSPAMSHHGVSPAAGANGNGGQNFANLPFGAPQHHQQQQQQQAAAAAQIAAHFNLPLGVGMPPGLQGQGGQQQGQMAGAGGGMGLPFATPPQQQQQQAQPQQIPQQQQQAQMGNNNANMMGGNPMTSAGFGGLNAHNAAQVAQQLQQHPNFGQLPPAVQQQVLQWQASQRQQQQQQQQQQMGGGQGGPQQQQGGQGQGGGMLPPGWPMAQR